MMTAETNPIVVSRDSWARFSDTIHWAWMRILELKKNRKIIGTDEEALFLAVECGGESGELMNNIKKFYRDGESPELLAKIRDEIADSVILLHHIASFFEVDQNNAAASKVSELFIRWPWVIKQPSYSMTSQEVFDRLASHPMDIRTQEGEQS